MEVDPFKDLKISDGSFLDDVPRLQCAKCNRLRKYFCYTCYVPMPGLEDKFPKLKLPVKIDIIKHPREVDGKSTAVHASVVAPEDVTVYTYPKIPDYEDRSRVILIFPGKESVTLEELAGIKEEENTSDTNQQDPNDKEATSKTEPSDLGAKRKTSETDKEEPPAKKTCEAPREAPYDTVVFIDSTWNQTMKIYKDERIKGLKQVELKTRTTKFWRHQKDKPNTYLATIEAIYYFVIDHHKLFGKEPNVGQFDDLLFLYSYMYSKIRHFYGGGAKLKAYQMHAETSQESAKSKETTENEESSDTKQLTESKESKENSE